MNKYSIGSILWHNQKKYLITIHAIKKGAYYYTYRSQDEDYKHISDELVMTTENFDNVKDVKISISHMLKNL